MVAQRRKLLDYLKGKEEARYQTVIKKTRNTALKYKNTLIKLLRNRVHFYLQLLHLNKSFLFDKTNIIAVHLQSGAQTQRLKYKILGQRESALYVKGLLAILGR